MQAAKYVGFGITPEAAWEKASCEIFSPGSSSQKKGCPKCAFLGLYGGSTLNGKYAQNGLAYLKEHSTEHVTPTELWRAVTDNKKAYNSQMHVVIALFDAGMI